MNKNWQLVVRGAQRNWEFPVRGSDEDAEDWREDGLEVLPVKPSVFDTLIEKTLGALMKRVTEWWYGAKPF